MGGMAGTANRRLDGKSIKSDSVENRIDTHRFRLGAFIGQNTIIGARTQTMPGVKIGTGCMIFPNSVIFNDVVDNSRVCQKK